MASASCKAGPAANFAVAAAGGTGKVSKLRSADSDAASSKTVGKFPSSAGDQICAYSTDSCAVMGEGAGIGADALSIQSALHCGAGVQS